MPLENENSEPNRHLDSDNYKDDTASAQRLPAWLKVGAIAAASALAGGLAATWFYRKTLSRLRQADENPYDSNFGINDERTEDE